MLNRTVSTPLPAAALAPATHARYKVVALTVLLGMVTYLDRVCISKLVPDIMRDPASTSAAITCSGAPE